MADPVSHDPASLFTPTEAPAALATFYTAPSGAGTRGVRLVGVFVCNNDGVDRTYQLTHTQSGGAAGADKALVWDYTIPGDGAEHVFAQGIILEPGDFLSHEASAANALAVHAYGWVMTD